MSDRALYEAAVARSYEKVSMGLGSKTGKVVRKGKMRSTKSVAISNGNSTSFVLPKTKKTEQTIETLNTEEAE